MAGPDVLCGQCVTPLWGAERDGYRDLPEELSGADPCT